MNEDKSRKDFDEYGDELFNSLYRDEGVFIFLDRKEPDSIYTQMLVNKIGFSFDIPHKDFFRLTRAMNFALRALKTERMGNYK